MSAPTTMQEAPDIREKSLTSIQEVKAKRAKAQDRIDDLERELAAATTARDGYDAELAAWRLHASGLIEELDKKETPKPAAKPRSGKGSGKAAGAKPRRRKLSDKQLAAKRSAAAVKAAATRKRNAEAERGDVAANGGAPNGGAGQADAPDPPRRRGRPKGSGTRGAEALALVKESPGITVPELAEKMGIKQNYLYRVLPDLAEDGLVEKGEKVKGRTTWHPKESAEPAPQE